MRKILIVILTCISLSAPAQGTDAMMELSQIQRCIAIIKYYESWHDGRKTWPYVGWGHLVQPGEKLPRNITRAQGDSLLYEDLRKLLVHFKDYGDYALILSALAYNVGIGAIEGNKTRKPSRLIQKIKRGRKDIEEDYLDFCHINGKSIASVKRRRYAELYYLHLSLNLTSCH